jgi:hypothetical protein
MEAANMPTSLSFDLRVRVLGAVARGYGTIRRFFARHAITRKKRLPTPANRIGRTS